MATAESLFISEIESVVVVGLMLMRIIQLTAGHFFQAASRRVFP